MSRLAIRRSLVVLVAALWLTLRPAHVQAQEVVQLPVAPTIVESSAVRFDLFGRVFFRPELTWNLKDYDNAADDTGWIFTLRTHAGVDVALPHNLHLVTDLTSYGAYGLGKGPLDPTIRLYQGYFELRDMGGKPLDLRVGRMELGTYGTGMLIAANDFYNGFNLDGWRLRYRGARVKADVVWNQLYADLDPTAGEDWANPVLFGTHQTVRWSDFVSTDSYLWWLVSRPFQGYRMQTYTLGGRAFGQVGAWDYSVEVAGQAGAGATYAKPEKSATVLAYAVEPRVGWQLGSWHLGAVYYRASGDDDPNDAVLHSFNTMWQNPHGQFGALDRFKGSNIQSERLELRYALGPLPHASQWVARVYAVQALAAQDNSHGAFAQAGGTRTDLGIGGDLQFRYAFSPQFFVLTSLSALQPGRAVRDATGHDDIVLRGFVHSEARF